MKITICFLLLLLQIELTAQKKLTSGGKLKPEQANMDIRHYEINVDVDMAGKKISAVTSIRLTLLQPTSVLLFDLLDSFNIRSIKLNGLTQPFTYANDLITINSAKVLPAGNVTVTIAYDGKPHVAIRPPWDDGFTWTKDSTGNPWMAVTAEGTGGKLFFPCKDHPSDEPDEGADMIISVPKGLVVAGPGLLQKSMRKNNKAVFHWKTNYPINNYSLVFNAGKYKVVKRNYTTVNGTVTPIIAYILEEHQNQADTLINLLAQSARILEKYFGEYPWAKEKIGISETPHLGMEHQTMNAYGNKFHYVKLGDKNFDWLLHHEFGHEWWGNKVTVNDWADFWIQEGICTFGDAMAIQELAGYDAYLKNFRKNSFSFSNTKPIVQGKDLDEETAYISDIYGKGAFFMHTLRYVMGDSLFFAAIKGFATDPLYTYNNRVNTDDVDKYFSAKYGSSLQPLFNLYLRTTQKLEIVVKRINEELYQVKLLNLDMEVPVEIITSKGRENLRLSKKAITLKSSSMPVVDPEIYYLTKIIME